MVVVVVITLSIERSVARLVAFEHLLVSQFALDMYLIIARTMQEEKVSERAALSVTARCCVITSR